MSRSGTVLAMMAITLAVMSAMAQTAQKPKFEVASVKPWVEPAQKPFFSGVRTEPGGRVYSAFLTLKGLMTYAYRVKEVQVVGGPEWINSDRWEIVAKAEDGAIPPQIGPRDPAVPDPAMLMLQSLLEDRFQLKMHRETRELPEYDLVIAKGGAKIHLSEDQTPPKPHEPGSSPQAGRSPSLGPDHGTMTMRGNSSGYALEANAVPFANFVSILSGQLHSTVIDKTGLPAGLYDLKLQWAPESALSTAESASTAAAPNGALAAPAPADMGPSMLTALQDQLGLRLVATKGPVEVIVIDHAERPTAN